MKIFKDATANKNLLKLIDHTLEHTVTRTSLPRTTIEAAIRKKFLMLLDSESDIYSNKLEEIILDNIDREVSEIAEYIPTSYYSLGAAKWDPIIARGISGGMKVGNSDAKCGKCGKRNVYTYAAQTRSADEGMTNIYICLECGNNWRVN